ncbi:SDR family NAD(P)-dependent oxidoreductase [Actinoplanes sp. NPDC020271]|uniref:SDR family NAD(P)-dependent oxidoreductase n=1 Tax=Actinoplanes sp. NPDC020271 TaxID=3363896 RepID=UPI00379632AE
MEEPRVWLVTGSFRGLGRAVVVAAAGSGARVMAAARRPDDVADLVAAFPGRVEVVRLDVTNPAGARRAVRDTVEAFGRVDVVTGGNAGDGADLRERIEADLFGVVHVTEAARPTLRDGTFVQVTTGRAEAAQLAAEGYFEADVAPLGIRVIIVTVGDDCDPARAAQAIVRVVAEDDPPRRLPLGAGALTTALETGAARLAETERWADVSKSV